MQNRGATTPDENTEKPLTLSSKSSQEPLGALYTNLWTSGLQTARETDTQTHTGEKGSKREHNIGAGERLHGQAV